MKDRYDDIIFFEEMPPERRKEVRAALDADPDLARAFARWRQIRAAVRARIGAFLPDRRMLVLYALEEAGQRHVLSQEERRALDRARPDIEQVLATHPGLQTVVARVRDDQTAFETAWAEHFEKEAAGAARRPRADRSARAPRAQSASRMQRWAWPLGVVVAAVVVAVLSIVWLVPSGEAPTVVTTDTDEVRRVELADGSVVRLMDASRLVYGAASAFDRRVALEAGRAFFEVAPDETPFVVETPTARTVALGTSFGVEAHATETRVVLAEGRVEVAARNAPEQAVQLRPGQASRVGEAAAPTAPTNVDLMEALTWTGLFVFRDTPMDVIAERLAAHYEVTVEVDPALREEAVTGTFEQEQPLSDILHTIAATLDAQVVAIDDGYRVEPA